MKTKLCWLHFKIGRKANYSALFRSRNQATIFNKLNGKGFHLKKLKIIQNDFTTNAVENLVVNKKNNRVFMSRNYRSDSCPLEI